METPAVSNPLRPPFLFSTMPWFRPADQNRVRGSIVGVPTAIIITTYTIFVLLPVFTDPPFYTSASDFIEVALKCSPQLPWFLWPSISNSLADAPAWCSSPITSSIRTAPSHQMSSPFPGGSVMIRD